MHIFTDIINFGTTILHGQNYAQMAKERTLSGTTGVPQLKLFESIVYETDSIAR